MSFPLNFGAQIQRPIQWCHAKIILIILPCKHKIRFSFVSPSPSSDGFPFLNHSCAARTMPSEHCSVNSSQRIGGTMVVVVVYFWMKYCRANNTERADADANIQWLYCAWDWLLEFSSSSSLLLWVMTLVSPIDGKCLFRLPRMMWVLRQKKCVRGLRDLRNQCTTVLVISLEIVENSYYLCAV